MLKEGGLLILKKKVLFNKFSNESISTEIERRVPIVKKDNFYFFHSSKIYNLQY